MIASRQVRVVGRAAHVVGLLAAIGGPVGAACAWTKLPSGADPVGLGVAGGLIVVFTLATVGVGVALIGFGWALRRRPEVAEVACLLAGALTSVGATRAVAGFAAGSRFDAFGFGAALLGGYLVALGVAVEIERRRRPRDAAPAEPNDPRSVARAATEALSRPWIGTLAIGAVVVLVGWGEGVRQARAWRALSATAEAAREAQYGESRAARQRETDSFDACVASDLIDTYCGNADAIAVAPDGRRVAVTSTTPGANLSMWDRESGRRVWSASLVGAFDDPHQSLTLSPDGLRVAVTLRDRGTLVSAADGAIVRSIEACREAAGSAARSGFGPDLNVAFSPDGRQMAVGGRGVCVVDTVTGTLIQRLETPDLGDCYPQQLTFGHDAARVHAICRAAGGRVVTWDARSGKRVAELSTPRIDPQRAELPPRSPVALYLPRDEATIVTLDKGPPMRLVLWNVKDGTPVHEVPVTPPMAFGMPVTAPVVFSKDGRRVIFAAKGLLIVDARSGQERVLFADRTFLNAAVSDAGDIVAGCHASYPSTRPTIVSVPAKDLD